MFSPTQATQYNLYSKCTVHNVENEYVLTSVFIRCYKLTFIVTYTNNNQYWDVLKERRTKIIDEQTEYVVECL